MMMRSDALARAATALPIRPSPSGSLAPPVSPAVALPPRPNVLVVEDEPIVRFSLCDALEDAGIGVEQADGADCALKLLLSSFTGERDPCRVLVTDVNLGVGLDGIALADEARRKVPGLPVLYITGNPERVVEGGRSLQPGECVLGKPFRTTELVAAVRWLVSSTAARAEAAREDHLPSEPSIGSAPLR